MSAPVRKVAAPGGMDDARRRAVASRALGLLDLTDLAEHSTAKDVDALAADAVTPHGNVAAVCIWPRFVPRARAALQGSGVRIATVVCFPGGGEDCREAVHETLGAVAAGADEIDLVMPYHALAAGRPELAAAQIAAVRAAAGSPVRLKVILESGALGEAGLIRRACGIALGAGADFVKTSTGRVTPGATPEAVEAMLGVLRDRGRPAGLKISGGVRTLADAAAYFALADRVMGARWARPETFRFGASALLGELRAALEA